MTSSAPDVDPRAIEVDVSEDELTVVLADGRRGEVARDDTPGIAAWGTQVDRE